MTINLFWRRVLCIVSIIGYAPFTHLYAAETTEQSIFSNAPIGSLETRKARVHMKDASYDGQIGFITVPQVRSNPDSKNIQVAFLHIYAKEKKSDTPVFRFHGGPDNEAQLAEKLPFTFMDNIDFTQSSEEVIDIKYDIAYLYYSRYLEFSDLVLMDGRGMGLSKPRLTCPRPPEPFEIMQKTEERNKSLSSILTECKTHFEAMGVDFAGYNLKEVADDIDALRKGLKFEKIALHGASFGTQTALAYLQRYDSHVSAASLVGIEGLDATYDIPAETQTATELAIKLANQNPDVAAMMPKGDMEFAIKEIYRNLDEEPRTYSIEPKGHGTIDTYFDSRSVRLLLIANGLVQNRGDAPFARSAGTARIPPLVAALYHKAYKGVASIIEKNYDGFRDMLVLNAAANVIDCVSGISPDRLKILQNSPDILLGSLSYVGLQEKNPGPLCHLWEVEDLGEDFRKPFKTNVPILIVNGDFDGITPLGNAQRLHNRMPNSRLVVVENSGHYSTEIYHFSEKFHMQSADFLRTGKFPDDLPERVTLPPIKYDTLPWGVMMLFKMGLGNLIM